MVYNVASKSVEDGGSSMSKRGFVLFACLGFVLGCAGEDDSNTTPNTDTSTQTGEVTYYEHVKPILDAYCVNCHSAGEIREQTPLDTYDGAHALRTLVKANVVDRIMPPWLAGQGCAEYYADQSLSEEQIATVSTWADEGGAAGEAAKEGAPLLLDPVVPIREDVTIQAPEPYSPTMVPDDYRCFLLPWPGKGKQYIVGFDAKPDNIQIVHHIIAFLVTPENVDTFKGYDEAEEGSGYTCFGAPVPPGAGVDGSNIRWLGAWAPGGDNRRVPPGTGLPVEEGSYVSLQVHYNAQEVGTELDQSAVAFMVEDSVEEEAMILPWTNFQWVAQETMPIAAGDPDASHSFVWDPSPFLGGPLTIHSASLHMHLRGSSARTFIARKDGSEECMLDIPRWDFAWQRNYGFKEPYTLNSGDKIGLECHWDNSPENQPWVDGEQVSPPDINWGEGTGDEMCLGVYYITGMTGGLPF